MLHKYLLSNTYFVSFCFIFISDKLYTISGVKTWTFKQRLSVAEGREREIIIYTIIFYIFIELLPLQYERMSVSGACVL